MVVLNKKIIWVFLFVVSFTSCSKDQFVEISSTPPIVGPIVDYIGDWVLDSVKITTKEYPLIDGVAYEVMNWIPNPNERDSLIISESSFVWTKYDGVYTYLVDSSVLTINNADTISFSIRQVSDNLFAFSSSGVYQNPNNSGGKKRFGTDSLKIDSVYYFSNPSYIEVSFASDIYRDVIYNEGSGKCMPCHGLGTPYPLELEPIEVAYTSLLYGYSASGEAYVDTTNPHLSHLYKRIVGVDTEIMPPASNDNGDLSVQEKELFYLWIQQGAKNN